MRARPPCFPDEGQIKCPCAGKPDRYECAANRAYWLNCKMIAELPDKQARENAREVMMQTHGAKLVREIWQGAKMLHEEKGNLL